VARNDATRTLLALLDEAYDRRSWHGPNLRGSLRGLRAAQAAWRPARGRHNAWELAIHAAYWKYAALRRLTGEKRGSFARAGSNWLATPTPPTEAAWRKDLDLLAACHRRLRAAVAGLRDSDLDRRASGGQGTIGRLVRGVAAHDLYHAGQIQLIRRLREPRQPGSRRI
jgi:DinB family protein